MRIFQCMATIFKWNFKCKLWNFTQYIHMKVMNHSKTIWQCSPVSWYKYRARSKSEKNNQPFNVYCFISILHALSPKSHGMNVNRENLRCFVKAKCFSYHTAGDRKHETPLDVIKETPNVMKYLSHTEIICIIFFRPSNMGCCVNELSPAFSNGLMKIVSLFRLIRRRRRYLISRRCRPRKVHLSPQWS